LEVVMNWPLWLTWTVSTVALLAGCATAPGVELPAGTLVLGEVRQVLTRASVDAGELGPGEPRENLAQSLRSHGYTDAQIDGGRVVMVRDRIYWNNTASGIKHSGQKFALLADGLTVEPGCVVEVTVREQQPALVVSRVRARSLAEGGCYYGDVPVGAAVEALGALSLVGPRGSATLYCAGIETLGWQRPRTYWHKLPGAAAGRSGVVAPPPVAVDDTAPEPAGSADAKAPPPRPDGLATLVLFRNHAAALSPFDLPVWVDGEKASVLANGECEVLLLSPGDHVLTAGTRTTELFGFPKRELTMSVQAAERVAVEYRTNQQRWDALGMASLFTPREQWEREVFTLTQRPATPRDTCAIRHAPKALRGGGPSADEKPP
jgi:hypothetical protein